MQTLFKPGHASQEIRINLYPEKNHPWNSFSRPVTELDILLPKKKKIGKMNEKIRNRKILI